MKNPRRRTGVTLIEVLMATLILAIALLGLVGAILNIHRMDRTAREIGLATDGASEILETILSEDVTTIEETYDAGGFEVAGLSARPDDPDGQVGRIAVLREGPEYFRVTVRVEWTGTGGDRSIRLDSMTAPRE